jgi:NTE family protein
MIRMRAMDRIFICCLPLLIHPGAAGQTGGPARSPSQPLKIGVALSGGGARGVAHIGVLRWFEEHRIPVDYLAGTSMGGLIGGMYAMGMTPSEISDFIHSIDWMRALASGPSYEEMSFRRKEDRRDYQVAFQMGAKHGIRLATRLSSSHYIGLMIDRLTLPYSALSSFDDLPIPYRCTATDFLAAKSLTLKDGSLASALRATMSIPGMFPPVERDGRVLVDGGLLNNVPTGLVQEMNADVVIAVDIGTPLGDLKTIETLGGILRQASIVMTMDNDRRNLLLASVIITPDLGDHSILDFAAIDELIRLGYQGAEAKSAFLQKLAVDEASWHRHVAARQTRRISRIPVPAAIRITGIAEGAQAPMRRLLEKFIGKELDTEQLEATLTLLIGQGRYESLDYQFVRSGNEPSADVLLISAKEKPYAPPTLDFGLQLEGSDIDAIHFNIGTRVTLYDIGKYGSEWRNDIRFGHKALLASEYLHPIGLRGLFMASQGYFARSVENLFSTTGGRVGDYQTNRIGLRADLGYLTRRTEFRTGYEIGRFTADVHSGQPPVPSFNGAVSLARLRWAFDGTDSATVPSRGLRFSAEGRWFLQAPLAMSGFPQAEIKALLFQPMSSRGSMLVGAQLGTTFSKDAPSEMMFTLGGPFRLGAYDSQEFRGSHYFLASLGYRHQVGDLSSLLGGRIYGIAWFDAGGAYMDFNSPAIQYQGSAGLMMDTQLGRLALIGAVGKGGAGKFYITFGTCF